MEYLFTCMHPKCTTVWHSGESAGEGVGQVKQISLFALIVNYWCRTLCCQKQAQMMLQCYPHFPFFLLVSPANTCHISDIKRVQGTESRGLAC